MRGVTPFLHASHSQTALVAALATTRNEDRAVVTGGRNYFRTMGAGFGLAAANAIFQHDLAGQLAAMPSLSPTQRQGLADAAIDELSLLAPDTQHAVRSAYAHALRLVFLSFAVVQGACTVVSLLIKVPFSWLLLSRFALVNSTGNSFPQRYARAGGGETGKQEIAGARKRPNMSTAKHWTSAAPENTDQVH